MKKIITGLAVSLFAVSIAQADFPSGADVKAQGSVYRVIDGDTFVINMSNENKYNTLKSYATGDDLKYFNDQYNSIRVRLASTDTEESKHEDESQNTAKGEETSKHITQILEKKDVNIACYDFGDYNRVICNVAFPYNGQNIDLGSYLISNGLSDYVTRFGNNPYLHNQYKDIQ